MSTPGRSGPHGPSRMMAKSKSESAPSLGPSSVSHQHHKTVSAIDAETYADFLEPAVHAPPSPGRIRAVSHRAKQQSSAADRHVSQQTSSSAASRLSNNSLERRPSWEQALESFSLSRKSSLKSISSSMPSKERPDSVQAIGKAFFSRKSKLRRESLVSPTQPGELLPEAASDRSRAPSMTRENIKSIFHRRKTVQAAIEAADPKKPQISSPFNFQHVAQIQRDSVAQLGPAALSGMRTPPCSTDLRVPNFSSKTSRPLDDDSVPPHVVLSPPATNPQNAGVPPPRPPRSPTEIDLGYFDFVPPMPPMPPAMSSAGRPSIPRRDSEALGNIMGSQASSPAPTSSACSSPGFINDRRLSRIIVPAETPNWPLTAPLSNNASVTTFEAALPDVPEEEEQHHSQSGRSHSSTLSSLRGSQSVPALRKMSVGSSSYATTTHSRTYSRDSVVLGHPDLTGGRSRATTLLGDDDLDEEDDDATPLRRDSWEDVIDYCYEHEMEADDEYDWHRPSLQLDTEPRVLVTNDELLPSRPPSDISILPALSPSSRLSSGGTPEAVTPVLPSNSALKSPPLTSGPNAHFSLPRRDASLRPIGQHVRHGSHASSFKESQGFTLSPSFLIPTDYHQELLAAAHCAEPQDPEAGMVALAVTYGDNGHDYDDVDDEEEEYPGLYVPARASASTTASATNLSVSERHISSTSTNTDYTRLTMSTGSVEMESFLHFKDDEPQHESDESEQTPPPHFSLPSPTQHARSQSAAGLLGGRSAAKSPTFLSRDNSCSDTNLSGRAAGFQQQGKVVVPGEGARARSRTLSSTPGQFSLFPAVGKGPLRG